MAYRVKLRRQGGSVAITLPVEVARKLAVREGATIYLVEEAPGEFLLTPYDPEVAAALDAHDAVVAEYRDVFRKLAE
jgi:putative addiction module antidote